MTPPLAPAPTEGGHYRQPIIDAAIELTATAGWSAVTMSRLAEAVGISRQTVYNEIGSKSALAETMILGELDRFLSVVRQAFELNPDNLVDAVRDAVSSVLELAEENPLLRAIASATHGADTELLPLLTTHAGSLLTEAKSTLGQRVRAYRPALSDDRIDVTVDLVVRAVLSHIMQPSGDARHAAEGIAWIAECALRGGGRDNA